MSKRSFSLLTLVLAVTVSAVVTAAIIINTTKKDCDCPQYDFNVGVIGSLPPDKYGFPGTYHGWLTAFGCYLNNETGESRTFLRIEDPRDQSIHSFDLKTDGNCPSITPPDLKTWPMVDFYVEEDRLVWLKSQPDTTFEYETYGIVPEEEL